MPKHIIRNPEHCFNRYFACEIKNDRKKAAEIREVECSLGEKHEAGRHPQELIGNRYDEMLDGAADFMDNLPLSKTAFFPLPHIEG